MIGIVKASTLAALRRDAAACASMAGLIAEASNYRWRAEEEASRWQREARTAAGETARAQEAQRTAEAAREIAEGAYRARLHDTVAGLSRMKTEVAGACTGRGCAALSALATLRDMTARARASGDPAGIIDAFQVLDAILGEGPAPGSRSPNTSPPAQLTEGNPS